MSAPDPKADLRRYLQSARDSLLWKLEGLSEYDIRRPMTRTGTNLLGLVKHVSMTEAGYFGAVLGRPFPEPMPEWDEDAEPNADMWATAEESREEIIGQYRRVWAHADATFDTLDLDSVGMVPWWSAERRHATVQQLLVHVIAKVNRHAGHADIIRELIDGAAGLRRDNDNLAPVDEAWWASYRERLETVAREVSQQNPSDPS